METPDTTLYIINRHILRQAQDDTAVRHCFLLWSFSFKV